MRLQLKVVAIRMLLALAAALVALLVCEGLLRAFYPKFRYAAESRYRADTARIWARNPGTRYVRANPDTGATHTIVHNSWALRQHREFAAANLDGAVNVAVFGDSFVENLRLPVHFSFTEPLDFLLNEDGRKHNVLNLGVDGYGPDQCYLAYRDFAARGQLRHVVYVFCANDVRNLHENQLFTLDASGRLVQRPPRPTAWWVRFLSRFHLTYLVVETIEGVFYRSQDQNKRIDLARFLEHAQNYRTAGAEQIQEDLVNQRTSPLLEQNLRLLFAILRAWRAEVRAANAEFHVVLLPRIAEHRVAPLFAAAGFPVIDLYSYAFAPGGGETERRELFFERDGHWNEQGNQLAALALYRQLARPAAAPATLSRRLGHYYYAMGERELPDGTPIDELPPDPDAIRRKYHALE